MENRNEKVIKVLKMKLNTLNELIELTDDENEKELYMQEHYAIYSCIRLLTDDEYLEELVKYYDIMNIMQSFNVYGY